MPIGFLRRLPQPTVSFYTIISLTLLVLAGLYAHNSIINEKARFLENSTSDEVDLNLVKKEDHLDAKAVSKKQKDDDTENNEDADVEKEAPKVEKPSIKSSFISTLIAKHKKKTPAERPAKVFNVSELAASIIEGEISHLTGVIRLMMSESLCLLILLNAIYCQLTLAVSFILNLVFGQLRPIEIQHMKEKFWNFVFYKFIFVFGVMNVQSVNEVIVWLSWFASIVFLLLLTKLCKDRFEVLSFSPNTPRSLHWKVLGLLMLIFTAGLMLIVSCVMNNSPFNSLSNRPLDNHEIIFILTECSIILFKSLHVIARYAIHMRDVHFDELWEQKATIVYHVDLFMEVLILLLKFVHHLHMLFTGNVWLSMASLVICMQLRYLFSEIQKRYYRHKNYRRVVANMEAQFPEATEEELRNNEDQCAICWDPMDTARRLPCGHLFHAPCLRSWLEQDTTCPTCRKQLDIRSTSRQDRENNNVVPDDDNTNDSEDGTTINGNQIDGAEHTTNHLWHFDGSRFASWLPSFYVEVLHARNRGPGAAVARTSGSGLDSMVREISEVFPQVPAYIIRNDLRRTGSVEATTDNILEGRIDLNEQAPPSDNLDRILNQSPPVDRLRRNLFLGNQLRSRVVAAARPRGVQRELFNNIFEPPADFQSNDDSAAGGGAPVAYAGTSRASTSAATTSTTDAPATSSTSYLDATDELLEDTDDDSPSPAPLHFSKSPGEREQSLQARQQEMIRKARLKYLTKNHHQKKQSFPLARFNTNDNGGHLDEDLDEDSTD